MHTVPPTSWQEVTSSNVAAIRWDVAHALLVRFRNGAVYRYSPCGPEVYQRMLASPSKGRFVAYVLKPNYRCVKE